MNRINTNKRAGKLAIFLFFTFLSLTTIAQNKDKKIKRETCPSRFPGFLHTAHRPFLLAVFDSGTTCHTQNTAW